MSFFNINVNNGENKFGIIEYILRLFSLKEYLIQFRVEMNSFQTYSLHKMFVRSIGNDDNNNNNNNNNGNNKVYTIRNQNLDRL
ncbi:unnamed protein product [Trichobilharzia regenti]|nr:unnamed protein product [Trichobilharzia regenti]